MWYRPQLNELIYIQDIFSKDSPEGQLIAYWYLIYWKETHTHTYTRSIRMDHSRKVMQTPVDDTFRIFVRVSYDDVSEFCGYASVMHERFRVPRDVST